MYEQRFCAYTSHPSLVSFHILCTLAVPAFIYTCIFIAAFPVRTCPHRHKCWLLLPLNCTLKLERLGIMMDITKEFRPYHMRHFIVTSMLPCTYSLLSANMPRPSYWRMHLYAITPTRPGQCLQLLFVVRSVRFIMQLTNEHSPVQRQQLMHVVWPGKSVGLSLPLSPTWGLMQKVQGLRVILWSHEPHARLVSYVFVLSIVMSISKVPSTKCQ